MKKKEEKDRFKVERRNENKDKMMIIKETGGLVTLLIGNEPTENCVLYVGQ